MVAEVLDAGGEELFQRVGGAVLEPTLLRGLRSSASAAAGPGTVGSGSEEGLLVAALGRKRLRSETGALACPVPYPGHGSPAGSASTAASAACAPEARHGGPSRPPGRVHCSMCGMCSKTGTYRLTLELLQEPGSAARAWLRSIAT
jgi:hypothetical protein